MNEIIIKKVELLNFRSHETYSLNCKDNTTLILGENGCGKTSVLEAIYIAMQGKSFRATDKDIVKRDKGYYKIELSYTSGEKTIVTYKDNKKIFLIKDKKTTRLPRKQKYPIVLFLPEDLHIITSSPAKKREYFDRLLSQLDSSYSVSLSRYEKALRQRNELLKQESITQDILFPWNILLAKYGVEIRNRRRDLTQKTNKIFTDTYHTIIDNNDTINLFYESYIGGNTESQYLKLLEMDLERDKITGHTNFGVHKDDYKFIFNHSDADGSASRGEMRSCILALKFIEANIIFETLGKKPVVLLDDVFSELDETRRKSLVDNFKNHQVILTSVE